MIGPFFISRMMTRLIFDITFCIYYPTVFICPPIFAEKNYWNSTSVIQKLMQKVNTVTEPEPHRNSKQAQTVLKSSLVIFCLPGFENALSSRITHKSYHNSSCLKIRPPHVCHVMILQSIRTWVPCIDWGKRSITILYDWKSVWFGIGVPA